MDVRSCFPAIASLARRVRAAVGEMHYAATRATEMKLYEGFAQAESDRAPDTYAEFLLRTSSALLHEPPARCRGGHGRGGR